MYISITWIFWGTDWKRYTTKNTPDSLEMILIRLFYWVGIPFHKPYPYSLCRLCRNTSKHLQAPQQKHTIRKLGAGVDPWYTSKKTHPWYFDEILWAMWSIDDLPQDFVKIHMWNNSICWKFWSIFVPPMHFFLTKAPRGASGQLGGFFTAAASAPEQNGYFEFGKHEFFRWSMFNVWVGPVHALVRDRPFCSGRSWIGSLRFRFGISWLNFKSVRLWITEGLHHYTLFFFKLTAGSLIIMMVWNRIFSLQHPSSCFRRRNPPWVHVF